MTKGRLTPANYYRVGRCRGIVATVKVKVPLSSATDPEPGIVSYIVTYNARQVLSWMELLTVCYLQQNDGGEREQSVA